MKFQKVNEKTSEHIERVREIFDAVKYRVLKYKNKNNRTDFLVARNSAGCFVQVTVSVVLRANGPVYFKFTASQNSESELARFEKFVKDLQNLDIEELRELAAEISADNDSYEL